MNERGQAKAVGSSFFANLVCLALATQIPARSGWLVTGITFGSIGLALGLLHGALFPRASVALVSLAALAGALVLCVPIIIVTYGFALLGAPLVLGYGLLAAIGTYAGVRIKERYAKA